MQPTCSEYLASATLPAPTGLRSIRERGFALLTFALIFLVLMSFVGLAVDTSILYLVQNRLSAAVDAGVLAGGRALARGSDDPTQEANAKTTALDYLHANFSNGWFGSKELKIYGNAQMTVIGSPAITKTGNSTRHVYMKSTVKVPRLFMSLFGGGYTTIAAAGQASRRDANIILVMDRSKSLADTASCKPLIGHAQNFVRLFSEGHDNMGLITYATSSRVDFALGANFQSASPTNMVKILDPNTFICSGGTSTAQALWMGYQELVQLAQPTALNAIVLFTDGNPTVVTSTFTTQSGISGCSSTGPHTGALGATTSAYAGLYKFFYSAGTSFGDDYNALNSHCNFPNSPNSTLTNIPFVDYWGNNLDTGFITPVPTKNGTSSYKFDSTEQRFLNTCYNAAKNAADRIHNGDNTTLSKFTALGMTYTHNTGLPGVVIMAIALDNGISSNGNKMLAAIANDPSSPSHDTDYAEGMYIKVDTPDDLQTAFNRVASMILRLSI